jgi:outer membrane protein OmpA-like peptidoglycan-associated protein
MLLCALLGLAPPYPTDASAAPAPGPALAPAPVRAARRELDRAQAQLQQSILTLEAAAAPQILREPDRLVWRVPARLLFDPESTIPREDASARALLMAARQLLRKRTRIAGQIQVFTDGIGGGDANLQFSQRRAEALLAWLTEEGVSPTRLRAAGRGATAPLASDDAPEGRMANRRVEFVFEPEPAA